MRIYIYINQLSSLINPKKKKTAMKYNEIAHSSHPQHKLRFEYTQFPFRCYGCKEAGIGSSYKCTSCDYNLHLHCALPSSPNSFSHPFYPKCSFQFLTRPPGIVPRYCNACERAATGFLYHCKSCGFDLHPCCAELPMVLDDGEAQLYLHRKVGAPCHRCGRRGRSWSYRSACKEYNLHVACVKQMLVENWQDIYSGRGGGGGGGGGVPSLRGTLETYHHHHHKSKGKVKKCCEMAGLAVQFIISAVLGDPTTLIAGIVGTLMSR